MKKINVDVEAPIFINKMLEGTGYTYDMVMENPIINGDYWYSSLRWDEKREQEYKEWFINRLRTVYKMAKHKAEREFTWFNLMYGLRRDDM